MTIQIKHAFVSLKGDGTDATQVQPSNWNALHSTSIATGNIVGRLTAGTGAFEEIPISSYMAGLLATADAAALAAALGLSETGDVKYTFRDTPSAGWYLMVGGTGAAPNKIGNASSGANGRANADTQNLFVLLYNNCTDAVAPVSGGRSGNALNDFNAGKTLTIPQLVGRSPLGAGAATNNSLARVLGGIYGSETVTIGTSNLPPYTPSGTVSGFSTIAWGTDQGQTPTGAARNFVTNIGPVANLGNSTNLIFQGSFAGSPQGGSSQPLGTLGPTTGLFAMVKL